MVDQIEILDLIIFFGYMAGILLFGISFYFRKNKTPENYVTGGGKLPTWAIGMSIFATFVSSISFLALPGSAYLSNWNSLVFSLTIPIAAYIAIKLFIPLYRKINSVSAYYYLEVRFGSWARTYASVCYLLTQMARMGSILYLLALPMNALLGWDITWIIIITGLSVIIYAALGGIEAVIWTDAIQGIILIAGAILCLLIIISQIPGGVPEAIEVAKAHDKFSLGSLELDFTSATFWVILIYGFVINLQNFGIDQNYIQRYMSAKNEKEAVQSTWFGSLLYVPVSLLFFMIGTALFVYYQSDMNMLPADLQPMEAADKIFPYFIVNGLPTGFTGLLIAAIFAAGMSTISTSLNSSSTIILSDHYKKYISKNPTTSSSFKVLRISALFMGLISIGVALAMTNVTSALDAWWALSSIFSGGVLGLFLLGYMAKNVNKIEALIAVVNGVLLISWMSLSGLVFESSLLEKFQNPLHANLTIVMGTMVIFLTGFLLSGFGRKKNRS
ncbi:sodium:solute symporter [Belliella sp. DSM 111904]|uniref:Sodium:solute symporter n=1 Tax=Belliella filtrata TaxID=2923435 RepID=A0ABS9UVD4_9BACT|nr:sodium:solute symporter [Belliella filtrata]MCH7408096.1 sodium:solute symporter [Belliella filtrata]